MLPMSQFWPLPIFTILGHISNTNLQILQSKKMVQGLPQLTISNEVCVDCLKGKQHREPIPKRSTWRATQRLELIHADLCGPISPISNSERKYVLCLIIDYSRKVWSYILHAKSDTFAVFKIFKTFVEKETGLSIKCLRTDQGGSSPLLSSTISIKTMELKDN